MNIQSLDRTREAEERPGVIGAELIPPLTSPYGHAQRLSEHWYLASPTFDR